MTNKPMTAGEMAQSIINRCSFLQNNRLEWAPGEFKDLIEKALLSFLEQESAMLVRLLEHASKRDHAEHSGSIENCPMIVCVDYRIALTTFRNRNLARQSEKEK